MTCHQNAASNIYKKVFITLMCIFQSGLVFGNTNTFATKKIPSWVGKYKVFKTHILIYESPYINLLKGIVNNIRTWCQLYINCLAVGEWTGERFQISRWDLSCNTTVTALTWATRTPGWVGPTDWVPFMPVLVLVLRGQQCDFLFSFIPYFYPINITDGPVMVVTSLPSPVRCTQRSATLCLQFEFKFQLRPVS